MVDHLTVFFVPLVASLALTPIVRSLAVSRGWLDVPSSKGRKIHCEPIPRLGGVAIFGAVLFGLAAVSVVHHDVPAPPQTDLARLLTFVVPATLMFIFGLYDDLRGTDAKLKFAVQGLAGTSFYIMGGQINAISVPFIGHVNLPVVLGFGCTVIWIVVVTNAFNLIDGLDGLAAGTALVASAIVLMVSLIFNHPLVAMISLALCGALAGFLRFNFNPATIFLGDSGSLFLGFMLAALSLQGTQKASSVAIHIPLMIFGLPLVDTGVTIFRRFVSKRPLFDGDREHVHHMLLARGWSQARIALILYGVCIMFGLAALILVDKDESLTGVILLFVTVGAALSVGRLQYHEVDEVKATAKRQIVNGPKCVLNNVKLRRASRKISNVTTLEQLLRAVQEMLECNEFVYVNMQIGTRGVEANTQRTIAREQELQSILGLEVRNGLICWSWKRGDVTAEDVVGSRNYWSMRLPLSTAKGSWGFINLYRQVNGKELQLNVNYLKNSFQREMARAVERVMLEEIPLTSVAEEQKTGELTAHGLA